MTDVAIKKADVNDFYFSPTPIISLNWPILLLCLVEHTSLPGLIWSEGFFSPICVCQMRETPPSCLTNTVQCCWLVRCCSPAEMEMEIWVFLFSGFRQIHPVKCYGHGDPVLLILLLSNPDQLFSRAATLSWALELVFAWCCIQEPQGDPAEQRLHNLQLVQGLHWILWASDYC